VRVYLRVYQKSGDNVDLHLARIKDVVDLEAHNKEEGLYLDLFRGSNRIRSTTVAMTYICQEVVGMQFVLGFSTYFFQVSDVCPWSSIDELQLAGFPVEQSF
jgi:SP family general alpha glucoside:H+ symporter-like MFS transporter